MMSAKRLKIGSAVLLQILVPFTLPGLSTAGQNAYETLISQTESSALQAPEPTLAVVEAPRINTRDARAVAAMDGADMRAASDAQRLEMLKTLIKRSRPVQGNQENQDYEQEGIEKAIVRLLASAPDSASFDRMFYNVDQGALFNSVSYSGDIKKMAARHLASTAPGDWAGLARYVDTVADTRSSGRNTVQFLIDGGVMEPAIAAIDAAKKSIHIDVYQMQADNIGWGLARKLAEKAKAGVKVRVLVDQYGSSVDKLPEVAKLLAFLCVNGVEARVHKSPFLSGHRDHRKVMVIDGDTGFTGGMNIGKSYQVDWHDQQTLVVGPAVAALQAAFLEKWGASGGITRAEEDFYPVLREAGEGVETRVVIHRGGRDQNIKAMYLKACATAQKSIRIANPYFADPEVVKVLVAAARRGVKVQVVLPEDNDMKIVQRGSRSFYPAMLKAGIEIYEYKGRMAHEKVAVLDGYWSTFGSSNLDSRSLVNNDELNLVVTDAALAGYVEQQLFDADILKSERITRYNPDLLDHVAGIMHGWL